MYLYIRALESDINKVKVGDTIRYDLNYTEENPDIHLGSVKQILRHWVESEKRYRKMFRVKDDRNRVYNVSEFALIKS